eukprot:scaffold298410_cov36-Tisochrysis_lutea.AAC.1
MLRPPPRMSTQKPRILSSPHLEMLPSSVLNCPAYKENTPKMGLPASVDALQSSKNLGMRCSDVARTPQDLVSINVILYLRHFKSALRGGKL